MWNTAYAPNIRGTVAEWLGVAAVAGADLGLLRSAGFAAANRSWASTITPKSLASRNRRPHKTEVCASPPSDCGLFAPRTPDILAPWDHGL